ncbi:MAG: hypothetical protein PVH61_32955 [Candidatus Aminicenantes bacterium]|jgi:hypothetical protein
MKGNPNDLKIRVVYVLILIFIIQTACTYQQIPLVAVREKVLCFGPVPIPLNEEIKKDLETYIRAGGDTRNSGPVAFFLTNKTFYSGLIDLLSGEDRKIKIEDLFLKDNGIYKIAYKGFQPPIIYDVIDARRETPNEGEGGPFAVSDGHLIWIFYRDEHNNITELVLTVPFRDKITHYDKN